MDQSPLALLPRELRDQIWTHALTPDGFVYRNDTWPLHSKVSIASALDVRLLCKQIHAEASGLLLAANPTIGIRLKLCKLHVSERSLYERELMSGITDFPVNMCTMPARLQLRLDLVNLAFPHIVAIPMSTSMIGEDIFIVHQHFRSQSKLLEVSLYYHTPSDATPNGCRRPATYETFTCAFPVNDHDRALDVLSVASREKHLTIELLHGVGSSSDAKRASLQNKECAQELLRNIIDGFFVARQAAQKLELGSKDMQLGSRDTA